MIPNIGPHRIRLLLDRAGSASELFEQSAETLEEIPGFGPLLAGRIRSFDRWREADQILKRTEVCKAHLIAIDDPAYPPLLKEIYDAPPLLWARGDLTALHQPGIAVIGTRRPDRYGLDQAETWTRNIVRSGLAVYSGLAWGIDAAAHKTALETNGVTVGVLGSGIDRIYPPGHKSLVKRMTEEGGVVVTEYPPGTRPSPEHFPVRNRIVSGMSRGVLVIQSGVKGGSMITARSALDQNREVFVVPHPLGSKNGEGCNYLIRSGQGKLVERVEDLLEEIRWEPLRKTGQPENVKSLLQKFSEPEQKVCKVLESGPLHLDLLPDKTGLRPGDLNSLLLSLELRGVIRQKAGRYYELT